MSKKLTGKKSPKSKSDDALVDDSDLAKKNKKKSWRGKRKDKKAEKKLEKKDKRNSAPLRTETDAAIHKHASAEAAAPPLEPPKPVTPPPPPKPQATLRTAKINKKKAVNLELAFKFPEVKMTPWGQKWSLDVFALIQNAVKAELHDLYNIINTMQRRKWLITREHISMFYQWWRDFDEFVTVALNIDEDVFFPWLGSKEPLRGDFKGSTRMKAYGALRKAMSSITEYQERFVPELPAGERLNGLFELVGTTSHIPEYYDRIAKSVPSFIENSFTKREGAHITKDIVAAFRRENGYDRNMAMLTRWMSDSKQKTWTLGHMGKRDMLKIGSWRRMMAREHFEFPHQLDDWITKENEEGSASNIGDAIHVGNREVLVKGSVLASAGSTK